MRSPREGGPVDFDVRRRLAWLGMDAVATIVCAAMVIRVLA
jgi:hypothetical protein